MSKIEVKHPDKQVNTGAYSAGVLCDGWLYVSGQGPLDLSTGKIIEGDIQVQTRATLANVDKILKAAGCGPDDVVKCTCHLKDIGDFNAFNEVYKQYFTGIRPARTTVQSVLWGGIKVEVDAIARVPQK
jgi:2-iminobutanoate/2-iminopropanoate deaminase